MEIPQILVTGKSYDELITHTGYEWHISSNHCNHYVFCIKKAFSDSCMKTIIETNSINSIMVNPKNVHNFN